MEKKKVVNAPEAILLVGSFFMFMFVCKYLVFIPEFKYFFERGSLWFAFPLITLILAVHSFINRKS
ncbi:hypothetical protein ACTHOQ_05590 [Solibacillus silvestris]|uniref:hypothetical protein n=1 Tax=Solibacillus silvestris TaxID=76853 RepID=UPI003F7DC302